MLRITIHDNLEVLSLQLEGRLAGTWVQTLGECWETTLAAHSRAAVRFDLTEVTFIDAAGKDFLAARYREGHELVAAGCLMKSVVAEITGSPILVRRLPAIEQ